MASFLWAIVPKAPIRAVAVPVRLCGADRKSTAPPSFSLGHYHCSLFSCSLGARLQPVFLSLGRLNRGIAYLGVLDQAVPQPHGPPRHSVTLVRECRGYIYRMQGTMSSRKWQKRI